MGAPLSQENVVGVFFARFLGYGGNKKVGVKVEVLFYVFKEDGGAS